MYKSTVSMCVFSGACLCYYMRRNHSRRKFVDWRARYITYIILRHQSRAMFGINCIYMHISRMRCTYYNPTLLCLSCFTETVLTNSLTDLTSLFLHHRPRSPHAKSTCFEEETENSEHPEEREAQGVTREEILCEISKGVLLQYSNNIQYFVWSYNLLLD